MDKLWHTKSSEDIIKELNSSEYGISNEEALLRLKKYGLNKLLYFEVYNEVYQAIKREKQIKGWSFAKKRALIKGNIRELVRLSNGTESVGVLE